MPSSPPPDELERLRLLADVELHVGKRLVVCRVDVPAAAGWLAEGRFRFADDDLVLVGLDVRVWRPSIADPPGITARLLRSVPLAELHAKARAGAAEWFKAVPPGTPADFLDFATRAGRPGRPGRAGRDDLELLPWAVRYADKVAGGSTAPVAELADEHGLTRARVRDLVHECRRRELLSGGARGRSSGGLTAKATNLIEQRRSEHQ